MAPRPYLSLAALVFVAGAMVLEFLVLLAGAVNGSPVSSIYFLQADTSAISGAPPLSRWTFWNAAGVDSNNNNVISYVRPAYPLDPAGNANFATSNGVPANFVGTNYYFYMTRFMFAFNLVALFFMVCAFFLNMLALCSRIGSYLASVMTMTALFFQTIMAALMTTAYVKGRDNFQGDGVSANIGTYAFGFIWASVACLFIATALLCAGGASSRDNYSYSGGTRSRFGRRKDARSRGSFIDSDSQRPVVTEV